MKTQKGTTRRVFIFKHVVIKIAIIEWTMVVKALKYLILGEFNFLKQHKLNYFCEKRKQQRQRFLCSEKERIETSKSFKMTVPPFKKYENYYGNAVRYYLIIGIMANLNERRFYKKTKNLFVMPSYFSFFGLINIQKRGKQIDFWADMDIFRYLCLNSQNRIQPHVDGHTLEEIGNFVLDDDGHIKLVDYGNRRIGPFLELNGENLYKNFKLPE